MDDLNSTVPAVLQPWGGPRACSSRADCLTDQDGGALPSIQVFCGSFATPELTGSFCSCDFSFARVGPSCQTPTASSQLQAGLNSGTAAMDFVFLVLVVHKFVLARATGKMRANPGMAVAVLGMMTLTCEFLHSVSRASTMAGFGGEAMFFVSRVTAMITMSTPGMALILSFSVWTKLARSKLGMPASQAWFDRALAVGAVAFCVSQLALGLGGLLSICIWIGALAMACFSLAYFASGYKLILKLRSASRAVDRGGANSSRTATNESRLRAFIYKVTVLSTLTSCGLVWVALTMQADGITSYEPNTLGAVALVVLKCTYALLAFVLASFTLDMIISSHYKSSMASFDTSNASFGAGSAITQTAQVKL